MRPNYLLVIFGGINPCLSSWESDKGE